MSPTAPASSPLRTSPSSGSLPDAITFFSGLLAGVSRRSTCSTAMLLVSLRCRPWCTLPSISPCSSMVRSLPYKEMPCQSDDSRRVVLEEDEKAIPLMGNIGKCAAHLPNHSFRTERQTGHGRDAAALAHVAGMGAPSNIRVVSCRAHCLLGCCPRGLFLVRPSLHLVVAHLTLQSHNNLRRPRLLELAVASRCYLDCRSIPSPRAFGILQSPCFFGFCEYPAHSQLGHL